MRHSVEPTVLVRPGSSASTLRPPLSKSDAHRVLVLRAVLGQPMAHALGVDRDLDRAPADVQVLARGLAALAAPGEVAIDCADGGAPYRFLVAQAAIRADGGPVSFAGTSRLGERPHGPLFDALTRTLGRAGLVVERGAPWPVVVRPAAATATVDVEPTFFVDGTRSSQYASALVLACAALARREERAWTVVQDGEVLASLGYLELTLRWLERAGFPVARDGRRITVAAPAAPRDLPPPPGDWSSIGYLLAFAWKTGSEVLDVDLAADHPDRAIVDVLAGAGLRVVVDGTTARVVGAARGGLRASGEVCPDLLLTLAAWACVLPGPSVLDHVEVLRDKESDRLEAIVDLVTAAGGHTELAGGTLRIVPPARVAGPIVVSSRADHRVAMAATSLAVLAGVPLHLDDPSCVSKSFPGFWDQVAAVGGTLESLASAPRATEDPPCD